MKKSKKQWNMPKSIIPSRHGGKREGAGRPPTTFKSSKGAYTMDNRSVTIRYTDQGDGICIIVFRRGKSHTYAYTGHRIDRLFSIVSRADWDVDYSRTESYFYYVG